MQELIEYGLMPANESERKELEKLDPYLLRARALDGPLQPYELGRALFQLDQRRGFKSNRKAAGADEKEDGKVRADISELRRRIEESGACTLGEFLARRQQGRQTVLARPGEGLYPDRALYEKEFAAIRRKQKSHHSLSAGQWDKLCDIIFFQRDLRPVEPGWCLFEDGEKRAAKALPIFQEFRMLQEVANLKLQVGVEPERPLDDGERERAMKRLRSGANIDLSKPVKALGLPSGAKFNLAAGGRKTVKGDETTARLASSGKPAKGKEPAEPGLFGEKWHRLSLAERNEIVRFLLETEEPEKVRRKAIAEWGLNDEQADAVANVSLVSGYGNLSEKAIRKLLPHMEDGWRYYDAVVKAEYQFDSRNAQAHDSLPYYGVVLERDAVGADPTKDPERDGEPARYGRITNPTVHIGLNQLRRVVNRLIKTYGKPEAIVVELARELKQNNEQRLNHLRQQREGRERNKRFEDMLGAEALEVTPDALRKLRLWEEQGLPQARVCPYTGRQLSVEMVMSAQTEVDHILPFSRTLDNSMGNLVVCMADANRVKGDTTPYEAFGHNPAGYNYDDVLAATANFPANKRWRFQKDAMERFEGEDRFLDRQLNETQYLSRTARTYLAYLYDERGEGRQRVRAIPGRMTALLRRGWGLAGMLDGSAETEMPRKTRDEHRHHAIDAFVVANTTQGLLHRFAQAAGSDYRGAAERLAALVPPPWQGFDRNEVRQHLDKLVVSYKPDRGTRGVKGKTTGQLHNETAYGLIKLADDGPSEVVVRRQLSMSKNRKSLEAVRDPELRGALQNLWDEVGGKSADFAEGAAKEGVRINGHNQRVRRVRVVEQQSVIPVKDSAGKYYKGYLPGGNELAEVWEMPDKRKSWRMEVVSIFDANQPNFNPKRPHPAAKRLMRLQIDDMGTLGEGGNHRIVRVRKITNAKTGAFVVLDGHNEANVPARVGKDMKENRYSAKQLKEQGFRKVRVDELGRVRDRGPFKP